MSAETGFLALADGRSNVQFQSSLERGFVEVCDYAHELRQIRWEPFSFHFVDLVTGKNRVYTPDYHIEIDTRLGERATYVVEVKREAEYRRTLKEPAGFDARAHIAAAAWCRDQPDCEFAVVTERGLATRGLANIKLIAGKRHYRPDDGVAERLLNDLLTMNGLSLAQLVAIEAARDGLDAAAVTATMLHLCATDLAHFDITRPLDRETIFHAGPRRRVLWR